MAKVFINESTLKDIGDAIREKRGHNYLIDPANMASEIDKIDDISDFWESALDGGEREYFAYAFGPVFNDDNFKPPIKIIPRTTKACYGNPNEGIEPCSYIKWVGSTAYCTRYEGLKIADVESSPYSASAVFLATRVSHIDGSQMDWVCAHSMLDAFASASQLKSVTGINAINCIDMRHLFRWCHNLETVEFSGFGKATNWMNAFYECFSLKNVTFSPIIPWERIKGSIDFQYCKELTRESIENIINTLSFDTSYLLTLSETAVENAFPKEITKTFRGVVKWNKGAWGDKVDGQYVSVDDGLFVTTYTDGDFGYGYMYEGDWVDDDGNIVTVSAADAPTDTFYFLQYKDETKIPQDITDTYNSTYPIGVNLTLHRTVENYPEWIRLIERSNWIINLV